MGNKHWVHIRTHDLCETLYVDGEQILSNDTLSAVEVLELVLPLVTDVSEPVLFTSDFVEETEDDDFEFHDIFPKILDLDDVRKFERSFYGIY